VKRVTRRDDRPVAPIDTALMPEWPCDPPKKDRRAPHRSEVSILHREGRRCYGYAWTMGPLTLLGGPAGGPMGPFSG
jgi:hypothetical protein